MPPILPVNFVYEHGRIILSEVKKLFFFLSGKAIRNEEFYTALDHLRDFLNRSRGAIISWEADSFKQLPSAIQIVISINSKTRKVSSAEACKIFTIAIQELAAKHGLANTSLEKISSIILKGECQPKAVKPSLLRQALINTTHFRLKEDLEEENLWAEATEPASPRSVSQFKS